MVDHVEQEGDVVVERPADQPPARLHLLECEGVEDPVDVGDDEDRGGRLGLRQMDIGIRPFGRGSEGAAERTVELDRKHALAALGGEAGSQRIRGLPGEALARLAAASSVVTTSAAPAPSSTRAPGSAKNSSLRSTVTACAEDRPPWRTLSQ